MDILLEERENQTIFYYCLASEEYRYDFAVVYSNYFLGKTMVISLQTSNVLLMCKEDIEHEGIWVKELGIKETDIEECRFFLNTILPQHDLQEQY